MDNINLEKFIYKDLQSKNYDFYCSKNFTSKSSYVPQVYAIKTGSISKQVLKQNNLKEISFTTQKTHNILHKRPIVIVKNFTVSSPVSDNILLCSILKQGIGLLPSKDISASLEKYLTNIQPLSLVENVFTSSQDKVSYFKTFSKNITLQSINLKNFDLFLDKNCSTKEKEELIYWFISKRSKELSDINVDKKITNYLLDNWKNDYPYLQQFLPFSQYLTNQIQQKDLDVFGSYLYSVSTDINLLKASKILGFTTTKITSASDKLFKEIEDYHKADLKIIRETNQTTFLLQHNDPLLTQDFIKTIFKKFLYDILENNVQKVDSDYCKKWYLHEVFSLKLPSTNHSSKVMKI